MAKTTKNQKKWYQTIKKNKPVSLEEYRKVPWKIKAGPTIYDYQRWLYIGRPEWQKASGGEQEILLVDAEREPLVIALRDAVWDLRHEVSDKTLEGYCNIGITYFFEYLDALYMIGQAIREVSDIDADLISAYIDWLRNKPADTPMGKLSYTGARTIYNSTKSVLKNLCKHKLLDSEIFPINPFPNSNRAYKGQKSFSKAEMERLMSALADDWKAINEGRFSGNESDALTVALLLIASRTGRNPTPLLELTRDAVSPHPIKPDKLYLLAIYKRRGNATHLQAFRYSKTIEQVVEMPVDVLSVYYKVVAMTESFVSKAPQSEQDRLWLYNSTSQRNKNQVVMLTVSKFRVGVQSFIQRHQLVSDDIDPETGEPLSLRVNTMRLRKTFAQRIWKLTGGNLLKTAQYLGNRPRITDSHYLEMDLEMEKGHRFVGYCMENVFRGTEPDKELVERLSQDMKMPQDTVLALLKGNYNTDVGRCSDPKFGKFSPKNGTDNCNRFLHCFRCENQVVLEDDLHRLYSFYWLLIKERKRLKTNEWKRIYGWVIKTIDRDIAPKFDEKLVTQAKQKAYDHPHILWKDRSILGRKDD